MDVVCVDYGFGELRSKFPETVQPDGAHHVGSTMWLDVWVKGGGEREIRQVTNPSVPASGGRERDNRLRDGRER